MWGSGGFKQQASFYSLNGKNKEINEKREKPPKLLHGESSVHQLRLTLIWDGEWLLTTSNETSRYVSNLSKVSNSIHS